MSVYFELEKLEQRPKEAPSFIMVKVKKQALAEMEAQEECAEAATTGADAPTPSLNDVAPAQDATNAQILASTRRPVVESISSEEFDKLYVNPESAHETLEVLAASESNYVDVYPTYIVGSFAVPHKRTLNNEANTFAFFMDKMHLIIVDDTGLSQKVLERISSSALVGKLSTAHCLFVFMKELLINDLSYMGKFEDSMESIEECMVEQNLAIDADQIMQYRRQAMRLYVYYQQIASMSSILSSNENRKLAKEDAKSFEQIERMADRLTSRAGTLKEYSLQLHELNQTRVDMHQNQIMQIFTIVTVLFAPLTLVTGWFGMNLQVIPGLDWPFMWIALIAAALVSTGLLLLLFRHKKWL